MPKFMGVAQYSSEGLGGLMEDGAAKRQRDVKAALKTIGGKLEAFYFSLGNDDCIFIVDLPDTASAAALSILAGASGVVSVQTTALLTVAEADEAIAKAKGARYRPPGGEE
ncbi:MAG: GYD domain-containing protein [Bryobacterales bacterium]|nr:GYD domain-containing protein [Bryobacterales bacterium]